MSIYEATQRALLLDDLAAIYGHQEWTEYTTAQLARILLETELRWQEFHMEQNRTEL